jgi:molybdate transport system ATP-binding protein
VALARALARDPRALLLDEPMAALDAHTRAAVRTELHELLDGLGLPTLIVSHDFEDASALATRVAVVVRGRIVQVGTPGELVAAPADAFVASLTGANLLPGVAAPAAGGLTAVTLASGGVVYSADDLRGPVTAVVDPTEVVVAAAGAVSEDSATNHLPGTVRSVVRLGNRARVRVGPLTAEITTASLERLGLGEGDAAVASFKALATRLVPAAATATAPADSAVPAHDEQGGVVA